MIDCVELLLILNLLLNTNSNLIDSECIIEMLKHLFSFIGAAHD